MIISVVTLFPELYKPFLETSLIKRAQQEKRIALEVSSLFNYSAPKERIDAPTYGHGAGMLIKPEVIERAVVDRQELHGQAYKIFFSPQGERLTQDLLREMYEDLEKRPNKHIMVLPARYEGMDARVEEHYADRIISVGDFVLMGGDIPAMMLLEGFLRLVPGVVGKQESIEHESFSGPFVDYPEYTEPIEWKGMRVPDVIRSGNHKAISTWREITAAKASVLNHFEWVRSHKLSSEQERLVEVAMPSHYVILMHDQVKLPDGKEGTTSVTSLDVHDIARSAATYGIKRYYIVTPLLDQQKIIRKLLDFWLGEEGADYNPSRHRAVSRVELVSSLDEALASIKNRENKEPLLMATSARSEEYFQHSGAITYSDQRKVWKHELPVVIIFGTGHGLATSVLKKCAFMLPPVCGFSSFNHLSVRSAAGIVFDRWLGKK